MTHDSDQAWHDHAPTRPIPAARRRWPWFLLIVIILALAGAGGVYAWPQIAPLVPSLGNAAAGDKAATDKEALPDLLAAQQKLEDDIGALGKSVADQQEQLKTITDQLAALASKVEALQRPAPAPVPPAAAEQPHAPVAQAAPKSRKPSVRAPKPSGPISTGGAPLSAAPSNN
ncbi:hypothetical protein [Bradyrhizobium sp. USDA 4454]